MRTIVNVVTGVIEVNCLDVLLLCVRRLRSKTSKAQTLSCQKPQSLDFDFVKPASAHSKQTS